MDLHRGKSGAVASLSDFHIGVMRGSCELRGAPAVDPPDA